MRKGYCQSVYMHDKRYTVCIFCVKFSTCTYQDTTFVRISCLMPLSLFFIYQSYSFDEEMMKMSINQFYFSYENLRRWLFHFKSLFNEYILNV